MGDAVGGERHALTTMLPSMRILAYPSHVDRSHSSYENTAMMKTGNSFGSKSEASTLSSITASPSDSLMLRGETRGSKRGTSCASYPASCTRFQIDGIEGGIHEQIHTMYRLRMGGWGRIGA